MQIKGRQDPFFRFAQAAAAFAVLLSLCAGNLAAQVSQGSIAGTVTDQSGAVLPGATVTVENEETGIQQTRVTDDSGNYLFPSVPPGIYTVRAEAPGFKTYSASGLQVQVAQRVTHDIRTELGEVTTQIEVLAETPVLEKRNAEVGQVISQQEVVNLPLNGRDFVDLAKLTTGVTTFAGGFQSTGISVNGLRGNQVAFFFDGVDTRTERSGKPAFKPSIDAIQEFRIQQNSFSAEFGRTPAAINLSLKSGGNSFHGALFEFLRNDELDARSFFDPTVDILRRNQFGGVISGPIVRNKTFFMFNYEGLRTRRSRTNFNNVPTNAQRQGNFSADNPIFDPMTLDPESGTRAPFPNNMIPQSRFGQIGQAALNFFPEPNLSGVQGFNQVSGASTLDDQDQTHVRIDHQISSRDTLFGRWSYARTDGETPTGLPLTGSLNSVDTHNVLLQETHTFSPNMINQLRLAWVRFDVFEGFPVADRNIAVDDFGLQNLNPPSTSFGLPRLQVAGLTNIGAGPFQPRGSEENIYTLANDVDFISGKHNIKFGGEVRYFRPALDILATPNGILDFQTQFTNQPNVDNTGSPVADLALGFPFRGRGTQLVESNGLVSLKYWFFGGYVQDEIKVSQKLTVNLGVRYEFQTPFKERFDDVFFFDYVNGRFQQPGVDIDDLNQSDGNNFAPRAGIAYSLTPKTVIRAGGGVFYGLPRAREFPAFHLSPPFTVDATLFADPLVPDLPGRLFPQARVRDPQTGDVLLTPDTNVFSLDHHFRTNYTYQWNFNIQQELAQGWLLEVGYVGNSAHKLTGRDLVNQAFLDPDPANNPTPVNSRRPNPNIGDVSMVKSLDNSNYHSLNVKLNKRFAKGFSVLGAYTWSKTMGIGGAIAGDQSRAQNARDRDAEIAPLEFNQEHRLTLSWIYELPFGRGKPVASNASGTLNALIGGWSFQGIWTAHTGFPLTPSSTVSSNVGRQDVNRPDRICDGQLDGETLTRYFDTSCFVNHPFGEFGNSGNGVITGPGVNNFDLTFMKDIALPTEKPMRLQFRAEFFNAFNQASFDDPGLAVGTPQFGVVRDTRIDGREIQFGLKLIF